MEKKSNEATPLRPTGDRLLNAPLVEMDLNRVIEEIKQEETWEKSDRNSMTLFKSKIMRTVLIGLHAKGILKTHKTKALITVQALRGTFIFKTPDKEIKLTPGQMIALQPDIPHSVHALEESFFILNLAFAR